MDVRNDRNYVNMQVSPCKMCMPMGGSMALKGVRKAMTIIHGSQGCSTYIRRHLAAHYNEPVDIASSSLSEEGTVYGGAKNLKAGIANMIDMYQPEVVGVLTSCLAETIGDDIKGIVKEVRASGAFEDIDIVPIPTPGYGGSQTEGYFAAVRALVAHFAQKAYAEMIPIDIEEQDHINIVVSSATCEDIREIKRIVAMFGVDAIILPDISNVLDAPYSDHYSKLSSEGTSREDFKRAAFAKATIELGDLVAPQYSPALYLEETYDIKAYRMPLPIGIKNIDRFVDAISEISGKEIPKELQLERGCMLDGMIDSHKHLALGKVAVFDDINLVYGISCLLAENGVKVKVAATGSESKRFKEALVEMLDSYRQKSVVLQDSDFETIRQVVNEEGVNLMIGNSDGKFIWEKDHIDFIRVGFPVHDHIGAQRKKRMGYKGSMRLLDEIANHLLDQKHVDYRQRLYDMYYHEPDQTTKEEALWQ